MASSQRLYDEDLQVRMSVPAGSFIYRVGEDSSESR